MVARTDLQTSYRRDCLADSPGLSTRPNCKLVYLIFNCEGKVKKARTYIFSPDSISAGEFLNRDTHSMDFLKMAQLIPNYQ